MCLTNFVSVKHTQMSNFGTSKVQFLVTGIRLQEGTAGPSTLGLCALDDDGARAVHSFSGCAARVLSLQSTFFETLLVLAKILRGFVAARQVTLKEKDQVRARA